MGQTQRTLSTQATSINSTFTSGGERKLDSGLDILKVLKVNKYEKFTGLYKLICSKEILLLAYNNLKSKSENKGVDNEEFDDTIPSNTPCRREKRQSSSINPLRRNRVNESIPDLLAENIMERLKNESFQFTKVTMAPISFDLKRKVNTPFAVPKREGRLKNKGQQMKRPLLVGIPNLSDKIVQEAMRITLELIYENEFKNSSHGFRPNRSCHTALRELSKFTGTTWVIEGDIKGLFDNVNHRKLENIMCKKIQDQQFIDLYWKLVRAGYLEKGICKSYSTHFLSNTNKVICPILTNIYLNEFDNFMASKINLLSATNISEPKINSNSNELTSLNKYVTKSKSSPFFVEKKIILKQNKSPLQARNGVRKERKVERLAGERSTQINSRIETRIRYVRYAFEWVIGITGNRQITENLNNECISFLKEELSIELSKENTKITHFITNKAKFLGVLFYEKSLPHPTRRGQILKAKLVSSPSGSIEKSRINLSPTIKGASRIHFHIPVKEIIQKLLDKGFLRKLGNKTVTNAITN